jgi:hypothetical protein
MLILLVFQTDVEIIVFLAIMLHKAPASFGLGRQLSRHPGSWIMFPSVMGTAALQFCCPSLSSPFSSRFAKFGGLNF